MDVVDETRKKGWGSEAFTYTSALQAQEEGPTI